MKNRFMRTIVFFDLPVVSYADRKRYSQFRKNLINEGFIMLQYSVYSKIVLNTQQSILLVNRVKRFSPNKGIIQILTLTEKQYNSMEYIIGGSNTKIISSEERLIVL